MIVAGFDVSVTRAGLGVVYAARDAEVPDRFRLRPLVCRAWQIDLSRRAWSPMPLLEHCQRETLMTGTELLQPDRVYIEKPALPRVSGTDQAFNAGRAVQVVSDVVRLLGWPEPELIQPDEWKRWAQTRRYRQCTLEDVKDLDPLGPWPSPASVKPDVYVRALRLGFLPDGSQDAADAALVAVGGALKHLQNGA